MKHDITIKRQLKRIEDQLKVLNRRDERVHRYLDKIKKKRKYRR